MKYYNIGGIYMVNVAIGIVKKEEQIKQYSEIWKYYNILLTN